MKMINARPCKICKIKKEPSCFDGGRKICIECSNICVKCNGKKDKNEFVKRGNICKECNNKATREYRKDNDKFQQYIKNYNDTYRSNNKDDVKSYQKQYRIKNKEAISENRKQYYVDNADWIDEYHVEYRKTHKKEKLIARQERCKIDPAYKLRNDISIAIYKCLKKSGSSKKGQSILQFLNYSFTEMKSHIENQFEPWMNWNNRGSYDPKTWDPEDQSTWTWQLDHIIPQSDLPFKSMTDDNFKKCWALENLRPYSAYQNILDGAKRSRHNKGTK